MNKVIYIIALLLSLTAFSQNKALFEKANALYNDSKYAEAIDNYNAILETGNHSSDLYFNLANAHYKLNNIAPSIFFYEKALQLAPNDVDIQNNLSFAQNMTIDAIDVIPEAGVARLIKNTANTMSFDGWARFAVSMVFCFVVLFLIYFFSYSTLKKRLVFIGSLVSLILLCIALSFAFHKYNLDKKDNPAIIFIQESKVRSDPNSKSDESFRLHEGTKVQVLESYNDWKKIKLADGKTGWINAEDVKLLNNI